MSAVCAAPASAGAARTALPLLTGTSVLSAPGTGYVRVRVDKPFLMPEWRAPNGPEPDVQISDLAHFSALMLVAERAIVVEGVPEHPDIMVFNLPTGTAKRLFLNWALPASTTPNRQVVPAGDYRLYVVASKPQRIVWRLPLSGGSRVLQVISRPASAKVATASAPTLAATGLTTPTIYLESTFRVGKVGALLGFTWFIGRQVGDHVQSEHCMEAASETDAVATAGLAVGYCPNGYSSIPVVPRYAIGTVPDVSARGSESVVYTSLAMTYNRPAKINSDILPDVRVKQSVQTTGLVDHAAAIQIWYTLD